METHYLEADSIANLARKAIELVSEEGVPVKRWLGEWAMQKPAIQTMHEVHNVVLTLKNPRMRWNTRVNSGILTEVLDYLLGLNAGFVQHSFWYFYDQWRTVNGEKYPYSYGERIFGDQNEINQWKLVEEMLQKDATTRHACLTIHRPIDRTREYIPCTLDHFFQLTENNKLSMTSIMRSQDALRGLFLDLFAYSNYLEQMWMGSVAKDETIQLGQYTHYELNLHIYEKDLNKIDTEWAKPRDCYPEIVPSQSGYLNEKRKRAVYHILCWIFKKPTVPYANSLNMFYNQLDSYWKEWLYFIDEEVNGKSYNYECKDIEWCLNARKK